MSTAFVEEYLQYSFDSDQSYQQGLAGIIVNSNLENKSEQERNEVLLRSRLFYFNRLKGCSLTPEDVQQHLDNLSLLNLPLQSPSVPTSIHKDSESRTLTFTELKELIESGKTDQIPNNRQIPNDIHTAPPSTSTAPARKKPWEAAAQQNSVESQQQV